MGVATRKSARTYENSKEVYNGKLCQVGAVTHILLHDIGDVFVVRQAALGNTTSYDISSIGFATVSEDFRCRCEGALLARL